MSNVAIFRNVFRTAGLAPHIIDGIIANLIWESGGQTDINTGNTTGDGGASVGAAQWNGARRQGLVNFARQRGTEWSDPETQALYVLHELNTTERGAMTALQQARNSQDATRAFMTHYERPGTPHLDGRMNALRYAGGEGGQAMAYAPTPQPTGAQSAAASMAGNTGQDVTSPPAMNFPILDRIKARMGDKPTPFLDRIRERLTEFRTNQMDRWGGQPQQPAPPVMPPEPQFSTGSQLTPGGAWESGTAPQYPAAGTAQTPPASPAAPANPYVAAMVDLAKGGNAFQPPQQTAPQIGPPQMPPLLPQGARRWGAFPPMGPQGQTGKTMGPSPINLMNILGLTQPSSGRLV